MRKIIQNDYKMNTTYLFDKEKYFQIIFFNHSELKKSFYKICLPEVE